jgi:DNA-binding XRE family transcriptional regulator
MDCRAEMKVNITILPRLQFMPDVPEGFQTATSFLLKFTSRPDLADKLASARQRLERIRADAPGYRAGLGSLRRAAGLSQQDLADRLGTSQPVISLYESGEREPSFGTIVALAEALNVSFDELMPALKNVR